MLPSLPDRKPMFDGNGYPTIPTRVWWQSVKREIDALPTGGGSSLPLSGSFDLDDNSGSFVLDDG